MKESFCDVKCRYVCLIRTKNFEKNTVLNFEILTFKIMMVLQEFAESHLIYVLKVVMGDKLTFDFFISVCRVCNNR